MNPDPIPVSTQRDQPTPGSAPRLAAVGAPVEAPPRDSVLIAELRESLAGEQRNPRISRDVEANLLKHLPEGRTEPELTPHGQPFVRPTTINPLHHYPSEGLLANLDYAHAPISPHWPRFLGAIHDRRIVPPAQILEFAQGGVSGITHRGEVLHPTSLIGMPLRCVDVPLMAFTRTGWGMGGLARFAQPLPATEKATVIPLVGDLYLGGEPLSAEVKQRLGIFQAGVPVSDPEGSPPNVEPSQLPMFLHGGRSVLIMGAGIVALRATVEGGFTLVTDEKEILEAKRDPAYAKAQKIFIRESVATQYIGVGMDRYCYHARAKDSDGVVDLKPGEVIFDIEELSDKADYAFVQRTDLAGHSGIFLDTVHQPYYRNSPVGGLATGKAGLEFDHLLLAHGAELSGVVLGNATILRKSDLDAALGRDSGMVCDELQVSCRAIFDDTHRLDVLTKDARRGELSTSLVRLIERDYGLFTPASLDAYLVEVHRIVGHNARICFGLGITLPRRQQTTDNLSVYGRIIDAENFSRAENPYQSNLLISRWVADLEALSLAAGRDRSQHYRSAAFRTFSETLFRGALGCHNPDLDFFPKNDEGHKYVSVKLVSELVLGRFQAQHVGISLQELLRVAFSDPQRAEILLGPATDDFHVKALALGRGESIRLPVQERPGQRPKMASPSESRRIFRQELERRYVNLMVLLNTPEVSWPDSVVPSTEVLLPKPM